MPCCSIPAICFRERKMTENDIPLVSFFKRLLDPAITLGLLYLIIVTQNEVFTGDYLVLMIITFFISTFVYDQIDLYRTLHVGRQLAYAGDIFLGWAIVVAMLVLIGQGTGLSYDLSDGVIWIWFALTPLALLLSRLTAYLLAFNFGKEGQVRSAVIIGSNESGRDVLRRITAGSNAAIDVRGFFDDRGETGRQPALDSPYLGTIANVGAYVRANKIKTIFICLPMSANPALLTLLED